MLYQEGRYAASINAQGFGESKDKKTPCFFVKIVPIAFHQLGIPDPQPCQQHERTVTWWITEKTIENFCRDLRRLGYDGNTFADLDPETPNFISFADREIEVYCKHEPYTDKEGREQIGERWQLSIGAGMQQAKLDDKGKRRLDAMFGKYLKAAPKATNGLSPAAPKELHDAAARASDPIPF